MLSSPSIYRGLVNGIISSIFLTFTLMGIFLAIITLPCQQCFNPLLPWKMEAGGVDASAHPEIRQS